MSMQCLGGQHPAFVLRKLTLQRKELNQLRQTQRVLGRDVSTSGYKSEWPVLAGTGSQDLSHSTRRLTAAAAEARRKGQGLAQGYTVCLWSNES